jgi:REP element-mobilizing transposase RayT
MNRGARKVDIFADDDDRRIFVSLLAKFTLKHQIRLIAWCLMGNHYHFESEAEGTPLTRMMHDLDGTYAKIYNERHEGMGCLFQGRFKSIAILDDDGLAYVSRYIHANPVALGIRPEAYPWSSCGAYLGNAPILDLLDPAPVLELMGPCRENQIRRYRQYLEAAPPPRTKNELLNDDRMEFYRQYLDHLEERCSVAVFQTGKDLRVVSPATVFYWIARHRYGIPASLLSGGNRLKAASIRTIVSRFGRVLKQDGRLQAAVDEVYELVARFR